MFGWYVWGPVIPNPSKHRSPQEVFGCLGNKIKVPTSTGLLAGVLILRRYYMYYHGQMHRELSRKGRQDPGFGVVSNKALFRETNG